MSDAKPTKEERRAAALEAARLAREANVAKYVAEADRDRRAIADGAAEPASDPATPPAGDETAANSSESTASLPAAPKSASEAPAAPNAEWKPVTTAKKPATAAKTAAKQAKAPAAPAKPAEPEIVPPWELVTDELKPVGFNAKFDRPLHERLKWLVKNLPDMSIQKLVFQAIDEKIERTMELPIIKAAMKEQFKR